MPSNLSPYLVTSSSPYRTERTCGHSAEAFRETLREIGSGHLYDLPLNGGDRAKERKVAGTLPFNVDEVVALLAHDGGAHAIPLLGALAADAQLDDRIVIKESKVEVPRTVVDAELQLTAAYGALVCEVEADRINGFDSIEAQRIKKLAMGLEARSRAITIAIEMGRGYDNA